MNLQTFSINGETILPITLFGRNRSGKVLEYHKKVMVNYFGLNINYIECPFPGVSHGQMLDIVIQNSIDTIKPTFFWTLDNDALILKKECINIMYDLVKNKMTLAGQMWQSNHLKGPNGQIPHPYISQAFAWFSRELYDGLNRPSLNHYEDSPGFGGDTMEKLTYKAKQNGYCIAGFYPSYSFEANTDLDNGCKYGLSNIYGPHLSYHCSQANHEKHEDLFVKMDNRVLNGEFL